MKNKISSLLLLTVIFFSCTTNNVDNGKNIEKEAYSSLTTYLKSELLKNESTKDVKLDSLIIVKIDTLTSVSKAKYLKEILSSLLPDLDTQINAAKEGLIAQTQADAYSEMAGAKNEQVMTEKDLTDAISQKQSFVNRIDSCQKIIDDSKSDNTTLISYLVKYQITITGNGTTKTIDAGPTEMTKDFKVVENRF